MSFIIPESLKSFRGQVVLVNEIDNNDLRYSSKLMLAALTRATKLLRTKAKRVAHLNRSSSWMVIVSRSVARMSAMIWQSRSFVWQTDVSALPALLLIEYRRRGMYTGEGMKRPSAHSDLGPGDQCTYIM